MRPKYHNKWWRVELNRFDGLKLTSTMHYRRRINQRVMVKERKICAITKSGLVCPSVVA